MCHWPELLTKVAETVIPRCLASAIKARQKATLNSEAKPNSLIAQIHKGGLNLTCMLKSKYSFGKW